MVEKLVSKHVYMGLPVVILCMQILSNGTHIWGMQAKALGNSHWAVISSPRADICLFFKSAKKEGQLALYMETEFSIEMGEYNQYSLIIRGEHFRQLHGV